MITGTATRDDAHDACAGVDVEPALRRAKAHQELVAEVHIGIALEQHSRRAEVERAPPDESKGVLADGLTGESNRTTQDTTNALVSHVGNRR